METSGILTEADVREVLTRYFVDGQRGPEVCLATMPRLDVDPGVVEWIARGDELHDPDYAVFSRFADERAVILDVGANYGYSATSIWKSGSLARVISFEPIVGYCAVFERLAELVNGSTPDAPARKRFEYVLTALSDHVGELTFHTPVINGAIVSALTTASLQPHIDSLAKNIDYYMRHHIGGAEPRSFAIHSFTSPVTTLDRWFAAGRSSFDLQHVTALKIDTEGFEGHVLAGARELLLRLKPLILAEGGHHNDLARSICLDCGYLLAERDGTSLRVTQLPTSQVNGFFIHPEHFASYRAWGLLVD